MTDSQIVDDLMTKCQRQKQRIAELEALLELQPCGHPRACVRIGEEVAPGLFVNYCASCVELEAARQEERMKSHGLTDRIADMRAQIEAHRFPLWRPQDG